MAIGMLAAAAPLRAQVFTTVEFSFSNPGARSLGLGGAFVALADDATAAFANPAGLTQLVEPEISLEARAWSYDSVYTATGRASGLPSGDGIDTAFGPVPAEASVSLGGVSFLSFVYPWKNWSFAAYQHQLINFEMSQEIQGLFAEGPGVAGSVRGPIESAFFNYEIAARSAAVGYRLSDSLSVGLGLSYFDPDVFFTGDEYLPLSRAVEDYFAPNAFLPEQLSHSVLAEVERGDWGLSGGFLWSVSPRWRVGGAYREGPDLELELRATAGPAHPEHPTGTVFASGTSPWSFPDVWALGASYRSTDGRWTAGFEWSRVEYSTVIESFAPELRSSGSFLEDADELHAGGEYAFFAGKSVIGVRLGAWLDPDHRVRNERGLGFVQAEHLPGEDEIHLAAGLGVAYRSFQFDLGVDFSERRDTASLSAIYSF
jgi:long-subunit fatty acid transport protein